MATKKKKAVKKEIASPPDYADPTFYHPTLGPTGTAELSTEQVEAPKKKARRPAVKKTSKAKQVRSPFDVDYMVIDDLEGLADFLDKAGVILKGHEGKVSETNTFFDDAVFRLSNIDYNKIDQLTPKQQNKLKQKLNDLLTSIDSPELLDSTKLTEELSSNKGTSHMPIDFTGASISESTAMNGWVKDKNTGAQKHYVNGELQSVNDEPGEIRENATKIWYNKGLIHRAGGMPAMVTAQGSQKFALNGRYHRDGGLPAITWVRGPYKEEYWEYGRLIRGVQRDGTKVWFAPDSDDVDSAKYHNVSGPAVVFPNGREEYFVDGVRYESMEEWKRAAEAYKKVKQPIFEKTINEARMEGKKMPIIEDTNMKPSFTDNLKSNATDAAYRVGAKQAGKAVKAALVKALEKNGVDGGKVQAFASFLDTDIGLAMIMGLIGTVAPHIPKLGEDPRLQRLANEMQTEGMAIAGNMVADEVLSYLGPALKGVIDNLPAAETTNIRVEPKSANKGIAKALLESVEAEEEEVKTSTVKG